LTITKQGFDIDDTYLGARRMMFIFWGSFFLLIYGVKSQLGIKGRRISRTQQGNQGKGVAGAKTAPAAGDAQNAAPKKQELPEKLKNIKPKAMKAGKRK